MKKTKQPTPIITPAPIHVTECWNFWAKGFKKRTTILWCCTLVPYKKIKASALKIFGRGFLYERSIDPGKPMYYATSKGLTRIKYDGTVCPQCGAEMYLITIHRGRGNASPFSIAAKRKSRAIRRYQCTCGHSETPFNSPREREISDGEHDDDIGVPKYPAVQ